MQVEAIGNLALESMGWRLPGVSCGGGIIDHGGGLLLYFGT